MEAKHTKGPWAVKHLSGGGKANIMALDGHGKIAQVVVRYSKTDNLAEFEGNLALIAAAPTMYQKLADTAEWLDHEINYLSVHLIFPAGKLGDMAEAQISRLQELRDDLVETLRKIRGESC